MTVNFPVSLPCKPVVWQYLQNKYGPKIVFPEHDWLKLLILTMLHRATDKDATDITLQYYTKEVTVIITQEQYDRFGDRLTKSAIRAINTRIEDHIHQQLYQYLEFYVHVTHRQLNTAIEMFQQEYNFPEEVYSRDTIKKYYQRKIQPYIKITSHKFVGVNVPHRKKKKYNRAA